MKKIQIRHRETGEYIYATVADDGCIILPNGQVADPYFWSYDEPCSFCNGLAMIVVSAFVVYAAASAIIYFTADDERKWMRECLQTASEQECKSQWFVMQRDKQ